MGADGISLTDEAYPKHVRVDGALTRAMPAAARPVMDAISDQLGTGEHVVALVQCVRFREPTAAWAAVTSIGRFLLWDPTVVSAPVTFATTAGDRTRLRRPRSGKLEVTPPDQKAFRLTIPDSDVWLVMEAWGQRR